MGVRSFVRCEPGLERSVRSVVDLDDLAYLAVMIISCSSLGGNGRLGNQLFQVASTLGLAERYGATAAFPMWHYEGYFENPIPHGPMSNNVVRERYFHHHDWELNGDSDLQGFLQSEFYFGSTKLRLRQDFVEKIKSSHPIFDRETICIQVRRGDYVNNPNYYQIPIEYYLNALITFFPDWREANIVVISDDIEYCKVHFGCLPNVTFGNGDPSGIEDMALGSACDNFIISNSSFGWWCAYLGEKPRSKIIHCGRLHAGRLANKGNADYYPERWTSFERGDYKIPLRDLTFTIPVYLDHPSRKENLDLILYMLQKSFDTNYIVCEQGGNAFQYTAQWAKYMQLKSDYFHRTKMLNAMATDATTPYIANWDCDVIVPPLQIYLAVEELRAGADMVYPYGGGFARMARQPWFGELQKYSDIGVVRDTPFKHREKEHNSVGGAVLFNKESFIDGGMENEYMISFGPEDVERFNRFVTLGYRVERIDGVLFHMNHNVGNNSSPRNPHFQSNVNEVNKVTAMSREDLYAYINTWPWRHQYTVRYYEEISEGAIRSAKIILGKYLSKDLKKVIDVGCGLGEWNNGNEDYWGIDYRIDKSKLLIPPERYIECDLNRDFPSGLPDFDLVLCLEVAEHLKPSRAGLLVAYLCSLGDYVLFSAAIPHQGGNGHVNEQWQSYWGELFQKNGYGAIALPPELRKNKEIELWYRQNIVMYKRGAKGHVEDFVLPEYYEQIIRGLKT